MSRTSTASSWPSSVVGELPKVPASAEEVAQTLANLGVRPSRRLGQSFLIDPFIADAEAALVEALPGTAVLEVGGGLGVLTQALVRRGIRPLTVIEKDPRLAQFLQKTFGDRIDLVVGDAQRVSLPRVDRVVGNLPFSVATPVLFRLFRSRTPRIVFLVQNEVAKRLAASPGSKDYGRLSLFAHLHGTTDLAQSVPSSAFYPAPRVDGRIGVHTERIGPLPITSEERFEEVVRVLFSTRRKQLGNLLPRIAGSKEAAEALAASADWPPDWQRLRPEALSPEAFYRVTEALVGLDP